MPESPSFEALTRTWSESVARYFDEFAGSREPAVDDVWVDANLGLRVRYRIGRDLLGARFRLDLDPTSEAAPTDAATLASILLHNLHATSEPEWVDDDGYVWWGDRPVQGWAKVLDEDRALTLRRSS